MGEQCRSSDLLTRWLAHAEWSISFELIELTGIYLDGDVARLVERRSSTPLTQVRFPRCSKGFFSYNQLSGRLSYGFCTPLCAVACINICAHVKYPVVHVRIRWVMETLKHPACTVGSVARLCLSRLFPGKATRISHGRNLSWSIIHFFF